MQLEFIKSGVVTTNAAGVAYVVFTDQIPYGIEYTVILTCVADPTLPTAAYVSNKTQTGFTITSRETSRAPNYTVLPSITVNWLVVPQFNS